MHVYVPQRHVPVTHVGPVALEQTLPQAPQLSASVIVSTHSSPQHTRLPVHGGMHSDSMHRPPMQTCPGGHTVPHVPQFVESVSVSTHLPPQH